MTKKVIIGLLCILTFDVLNFQPRIPAWPSVWDQNYHHNYYLVSPHSINFCLSLSIFPFSTSHYLFFIYFSPFPPLPSLYSLHSLYTSLFPTQVLHLYITSSLTLTPSPVYLSLLCLCVSTYFPYPIAPLSYSSIISPQTSFHSPILSLTLLLFSSSLSYFLILSLPSLISITPILYSSLPSSLPCITLKDNSGVWWCSSPSVQLVASRLTRAIIPDLKVVNCITRAAEHQNPNWRMHMIDGCSLKLCVATHSVTSSRTAPTISWFLHSYLGLATHWRMCKCSLFYSYSPLNPLSPLLFIVQYFSALLSLLPPHSLSLSYHTVYSPFLLLIPLSFPLSPSILSTSLPTSLPTSPFLHTSFTYTHLSPFIIFFLPAISTPSLSLSLSHLQISHFSIQ